MSKVLRMLDFDDLLTCEHYDFIIEQEMKQQEDQNEWEDEDELEFEDDREFVADDIPF